MVRLPASLDRQLQEHFPHVRDRERFVAQVLEEALAASIPSVDEDSKTPVSIGGTLHLFTDGGSRGNPGQAAIGCVIIDPESGKVVKEHAAQIGFETNNVAEYRALIEGLKLAQQYQPNVLLCHLDSELVVRQLNGEYRVKMPTLQPLVEEVQTLAAALPRVSYVHVPRAENHRADALVNKVLDGK